MSSIVRKLMSAAGGGAVEIEDVFSIDLYDGTSGPRSITNGLDFSGEGGLVWIKIRTTTGVMRGHQLFDTNRGTLLRVDSSGSAPQSSLGLSLTAFNPDGFSLDSSDSVNSSNSTHVAWSFRKAPKFFDVVTYTGNGTAGRNVAHNLGATVGSIIIKRTDTTADWAVYHRANTAAPETDYLVLNRSLGTADDDTYWNDTLPTESVFTLGSNSNVNASGGTYVAYLFAHDTDEKSLVQCGGYTGNGTTNNTITLGFEPQWIMLKATSFSDSDGGWWIADSVRGVFTPSSDVDFRIGAHLGGGDVGATAFIEATSTGFKLTDNDIKYNGNNQQYVYYAIRAEGV